MKKSSLYLLLAAIALTGCNKKTDDTATTDDSIVAVPVKTIQLTMQDIDRSIDVATNLEAWETVNIAPSVTGKIQDIFVEVGTHVKKGQKLIVMDELQYKTSKLQFVNLGVDLDRMASLVEMGSVSQQNYDQTKLAYDQAKENLDFLETNTYVMSPCNGVVTAKNNEEGELYGGQPILTIQQVDQLKCLMPIPESYLPRIKEGMQVDITTDLYPGESFPAKIVTIYPTIDPTTHMFQAKLCVPNKSGRLRPGAYIQTHLPLGTERAIVVPYQTVMKLTGANTRYIFTNNNGVAKRLDVTTGQRFDEMIEISGDSIMPGLEIISTGQGKCVDGTKIRVTTDEEVDAKKEQE